jgi:RNA polymerase sigma-70 factor (ECF subfamily)
VQSAAWELRYVDGHKLEQVASLCDCSLATAKRRIAAADAIVRQHVQLEVADDL